MKLAFSTLACPQWSIQQIIDHAASMGYQGIELHILDGKELDPVRDADKIKRAVEQSCARGIEICALDTPCTFNQASLDARFEQVEKLRQWIRLAHELHIPILRVFGGESVTMPYPHMRTIERYVVEALCQVVLEAEEACVIIALETHDAFSSARSVASVLKQVKSPFIGAVWNSQYPYRAGESVDDVGRLLGEDIALVHVKDARRIGHHGERWQATLLGEGELPIQEQLHMLQQMEYQGYVSVKWGKKWHPDIPEPEIALPQHIRWLKQFPYWKANKNLLSFSHS
ncbi:MAG TPA: sugar phosphate isomerase/epimerase family protein [Ktedonobacteraceae bacterium]